ncbi:hypothetical protein SynRS9907_01366 [Synechococcus sp. RS9907]|nr:hypothetical protein SynRS9907_01366 [Synechococcus sp. RS9907]
MTEYFHDLQSCFVIHVTDWRDALPSCWLLRTCIKPTGKKEGHPCKGMAYTLLAFFEAERSVWLYGLSGQSGSF